MATNNQLYQFLRLSPNSLVAFNHTRESLEQLSAIRGEIFTGEEHKLMYANTFMDTLLHMYGFLANNKHDPDELRTFVSIISKFVGNFGAELLGQVAHFDLFCRHTVDLTCLILDLMRVSDEVDNSHYTEAFGTILREVWCVLISELAPLNDARLKDYAAAIFEKYVQVRLETAKQEALQEEEDDLIVTPTDVRSNLFNDHSCPEILHR